MNEYQESSTHSTSGTPRWVGLAVAVLGGVSLLGLGIGVSALRDHRRPHRIAGLDRARPVGGAQPSG